MSDDNEQPKTTPKTFVTTNTETPADNVSPTEPVERDDVQPGDDGDADTPRDADGVVIPENDEPGTPSSVRPLADLATPGPDGEHGPTGDAPVDTFAPGDQTAAGYLTPEGSRHPGEPAPREDLPTGPGVAKDPLDPYSVNR